MYVIIEGVAMPPEDGCREIQLFAYTQEDDSETDSSTSLRSARHAEQIKNLITGNAIRDAVPPRDENHTPLFAVSIRVLNTRGKTSGYVANYTKFDGCPLNATRQMMDIYRAVNRNLREGLESLRERKSQEEKETAK